MPRAINRRRFVETAAAAFAAAVAPACVKPCVPGSPIPTPVPSDPIDPAPLCQVSFSVTDLDGTHRWYQEKLGFLDSGGTFIFRGILASTIQGVPDVVSNTKWLVDRQEFRQLEMFEYERPKPKIYDRRPNDVGYMMLGIHAGDFDDAVSRLQPLTEPKGPPGKRRVCIRDPEGALLELMEEDPREPGSGSRPRPAVPVAIRSITLAVPDLDRSRRFFVETLKLKEESDPDLLHSPSHEELWGLPGAKCEKVLLWAHDFLIELRQYTDPVGEPWPAGYRICDRGFLNIAFGFREEERLYGLYDRIREAGYTSNSAPFEFPGWTVVYVNDDSCFSIELLHVDSLVDRFMGFEPMGRSS
jgi:catechol 2,3-dioxygenase-like lactoylglutathione lyase family enzyme